MNSQQRRVARRAEERAARQADARVSTRDLMRAPLPKQPRAAKLTPLQRNDWNRPANLPYRISVTTGDRRWDA